MEAIYLAHLRSTSRRRGVLDSFGYDENHQWEVGTGHFCQSQCNILPYPLSYNTGLASSAHLRMTCALRMDRYASAACATERPSTASCNCWPPFAGCAVRALAAEEKERKRLYVESRAAHVAAMNADLEHTTEALQGLLAASLKAGGVISISSLKKPVSTPPWKHARLGPVCTRWVRRAPAAMARPCRRAGAAWCA